MRAPTNWEEVEFRRAPAAGNLFVNRIAIVKDIYLPTYVPTYRRIRRAHEHQVWVARPEGTQGTGLLPQRMRLDTPALANYTAFSCFVMSFLPLYFVHDSSRARKTDKTGGARRFFRRNGLYLYFCRAERTMNFLSSAVVNVCSKNWNTSFCRHFHREIWRYWYNALHIICILYSYGILS